MTPQRRAGIIRLLKEGGPQLRAATGAIPPEFHSLRPAPECWSVLEILEHVVLVEHGMFRLVRAARPPENEIRKNEPNSETEARIASTASDRRERLKAPEAARPAGRFSEAAQALAAFQHARERTLRFVQECNTDPARVAALHPAFGAVSGYELLLIMAGHVRRHVAQIDEIKQSLPGTALPG